MLKLFFRVILISYFSVLLWLLLIEIGSVDRKSHFSNPMPSLIPFQVTSQLFQNALDSDTRKGHWYALTANVVGNIILFIPCGFFTSLAFERLKKPREVVLFGFLISVIVELIQYRFKLGILDVDDIIYNTVGTAIGQLILHIFIYHLSSKNDS